MWTRKKPKKLSTVERQRREHARTIVTGKVTSWSAQMDIRTGRVAIRNQRTRWGSASELGNLNFNWRVAYLPEHIADYIVIHELAHLREMNHSSAFWEIVEQHCPEYRTHRRWLRTHGHRYQTV